MEWNYCNINLKNLAIKRQRALSLPQVLLCELSIQ